MSPTLRQFKLFTTYFLMPSDMLLTAEPTTTLMTQKLPIDVFLMQILMLPQFLQTRKTLTTLIASMIFTAFVDFNDMSPHFVAFVKEFTTKFTWQFDAMIRFDVPS